MHYRNDAGVLVEIDDATYAYHGYLLGNHDLRHSITGASFTIRRRDGTTGLLDDAGWDDLLERHRLRVVSRRSHDLTRLLNDASAMSIAEASRLDPGVRMMLHVCQRLDELKVRNGEKAIAIALADPRGNVWTADLRAEFGDPPLPRTIRSWRASRGTENARHAAQMVRQRGRLARSMWNPVEEEILWKHAVDHLAKAGGIRSSHAEYESEINLVNEGRHPVHPKPAVPYRVVGERTFRRRVERLESDRTHRAKHGEERRYQDWHGSGRAMRADHVMQKVIVDHSQLDMFVVDDRRGFVLGRPWLSVAIDVRTRAIVAWVISFSPPSVWTVSELLRRMSLPKRPPKHLLERFPILRRIRGRPDQLVCDNAQEFRSLTLTAAARGCGFSIMYGPVRKKRYRAIVERNIKEFVRRLCEEAPGRTLPPEEAREAGYDAEAHAFLIMDEVDALANCVAAEINTEFHPDVGMAPADAFRREAARTGVVNMRDFERFRIEVLAVIPSAQLDAAGITRWGLRFAHWRNVPTLLNDMRHAEPRRERREDATVTVEFRYDPRDISRIWVWNRHSHSWLELDCDDPEYARGMPLAFHIHLQDLARAQHASFVTPEEMRAFRTKRIAAVRAISPDATARRRREYGRLMENPRIRAMTGRLVDEEVRSSHDGDMTDFLGAECASLTSVDMEILGLRPGGAPSDDEDEGAVEREPRGRFGTSPRRRRGAVADRGRLEDGGRDDGDRRRRAAPQDDDADDDDDDDFYEGGFE